MCLSIGLLDSLFIGCSIDRTKGSGYVSRSPCLYHFSSSLGHIPTCNFQVEETFPSQCRLLAVVQPLKEKKKKEKPRFDGIDGQRGRKIRDEQDTLSSYTTSYVSYSVRDWASIGRSRISRRSLGNKVSLPRPTFFYAVVVTATEPQFSALPSDILACSRSIRVEPTTESSSWKKKIVENCTKKKEEEEKKSVPLSRVYDARVYECFSHSLPLPFLIPLVLQQGRRSRK